MKTMPLNLMDLVPRESTFTLSTRPNESFTLCRWSLRIREWATSKYTPEGLQEIFEKQKIGEIAEIAFFMLKDKEKFKSKDEFLDCISSIRDQLNIVHSLLETVGIGEPEMEKIKESLPKSEGQEEPKKEKKKKTGERSLTP